jgi:triacylglycerol lipase
MSRHLVDPELEGLLNGAPMKLDDANLAATRAEMLRMRALMPVPTELPVSMTVREIPGPAGAPPVAVAIYQPTETKPERPAILHLHGGGYVMGSATMNEARHRRLATDLDCVIVSVEYRLAPETPHPGPVEDGYAALRWLHGEAKALGVGPSRIGLMGESAGGGLAAALALLARDRGDFPLSFQHLIYPMLDDRTCVHPDPHPHTGQVSWAAQQNARGWSALLGKAPGAEDVCGYASPARATDLSGLPATFISVGALDLFLEEDMEYARRLTRAGVPVELHIYPGAMHGFVAAAQARVARQAERDSLESLRRAMYG